MHDSKRPVVIVGNWKMYKTIEETNTYIQELSPMVKDSAAKVYLAVPFTAIQSAASQAQGTSIVIGAQNMNSAAEGAFTGEIAGKMLKDAGAQFVIVGHSERRRLFAETDAMINQKIKRGLADGLQVILCIGESKEQHLQDKTNEVLKAQLDGGLADITAEQFNSLMIAYEPVWAIGTQEAATPEVAEKAHAFCREWAVSHADADHAEKLVILYGGSVSPENAAPFLEQPDIDGLLVGGASLSAATFSQIVNCKR